MPVFSKPKVYDYVNSYDTNDEHVFTWWQWCQRGEYFYDDYDGNDFMSKGFQFMISMTIWEYWAIPWSSTLFFDNDSIFKRLQSSIWIDASWDLWSYSMFS